MTIQTVGRLALPLAALAVAACQPPAASDTDADGGTEQTLPTRIVTLTNVTRGDVVERVELTGELQGSDEVRVFPLVSERIVSLHVKEGQKVRAGALLAVLQADLLAAGESQAKAGVEAAKANLAAIEDNLKRTRALAQAGAVTASQLEGLVAQKLAAEAQVRQLEAAAVQASSQRDRSRIVAPISGVVTGLVLRPGDLAAPSVPLLTLVKQDQVKAVLRVPERDFLRVEPGMPVTISPLARPDIQVKGEVNVRGPVVDRTTRTGLVEVHLDNRDGRLLAGSAIRAVIELGRRPDVVLVPAEAVLFTTETDVNGKATAFVAEGEIARQRSVRVGVRQGPHLEVVEGLNDGEQLVVQGASFLRDGNPIKTADAAPARGVEGSREVVQ